MKGTAHEPWPYRRFTQSVSKLRIAAALTARPLALLVGGPEGSAPIERLARALGDVGVEVVREGAPRTGPADVMVADVTEGGGAERVARQARALPGMGDVPILLLVPPGWEDESLGVSDVDVIAPPFLPRTLRRRIALLAELSRARRALALTHRALDASVNGVSIADASRPGQPLIYVSPAFERMTGYSSAEVLGKSCRLLQGPRTDRRTVERMARSIGKAEELRVLVENYRKDGSVFMNELTLVPAVEADGSVPYIIGVQHDVSELVEARAELIRLKDQAEERRVFVESILSGIPTAVATTDADDRITFVNRAACDLLEVSSEDCLGHDVTAAFRIPEHARPALGDAHSVRFTYSSRRADGLELPIGMSVSRPADARGPHKGGSFFIFRDLSQAQHSETEARRIDRLAALGIMMSGFAHEVRNPVAGIRLLVEAMQEDMDPSDPRLDYVDRTMRQVDRIERLVRTALQFGRPEPPSRRRCLASAIAAQAIDALLPRTRELGGAIALDVEPSLPVVFVDEGQILQALVILLTNALEATGRSDGVHVAVEAEAVSARATSGIFDGAGGARISVRDEGQGIPEHLVSRIFDPFFTTKASGTGLGLSIAQQLVFDNGARLEVASAPGNTVFAITLPAAGPDDA